MTEPILCITCAAIRGLCLDDCDRDHKHRRGAPNVADEGVVCGSCRVALERLPLDVADAFSHIPWLLQPSTGKAGEVRAKDPDPPMPLSDIHDLADLRLPPLGPIAAARLAEWPQDQIGRLSVAGILWGHVRVWVELRGMGETGPEPTVPRLCEWLAVRTPWAVEHLPAVDEYAADLVDLRGLLLAMVGRETPDERPKPLPGVWCPRCRRVALVREPRPDREGEDQIRCTWQDCGRVYHMDDWATVSKATAKALKRGDIDEEEVLALNPTLRRGHVVREDVTT